MAGSMVQVRCQEFYAKYKQLKPPNHPLDDRGCAYKYHSVEKQVAESVF